MDDLIAFVTARLDEDEATAGAARKLREVAFKRAILAMHTPVPFWGNNPPPRSQQTAENAVAWYCDCQCPDGVIEGEYPCDTARLTAAVWSDHPDCRQEWKP